MMYYLHLWSAQLAPLNVFTYVTFRSVAAAITAFMIAILFGNFVIRKLISLKIGQPIRTAKEVHRLAELHGGKQGVPTMGGVLIIGAAVIWHNMMETFYDKEEFVDLVRDNEDKLQREFVQPGQMITVSACSAKGGIRDLFLKEAPPKGCTTYKDPKVNKQLHAAPSNNTTRPATRVPASPQAPPTPIPGIGPPEYTP